MPETTAAPSEERVEYSQWRQVGNSKFYPTDNSKIVKKVSAGVYNIRYNQNIGYYLVKKKLSLDDLIRLPMPEGDEMLKGIETFWDREDKFREYGYAYKRGVLMYGIPGGGKTCLINLLCEKLIKEKAGVIFTLTNSEDLSMYSTFMPDIYRTIEPTRPIITIIEDIDGLCQDKGVETKLLNVLDGLEQVENVVYLATTNYTEKLSERITNRPNRFDIRIEVKSPNAECRRIYFEHKLKPLDIETIDLSEWVDQTEGMTMAALGEVIKSVLILGNTFDSTIERLGGMSRIISSRDYNKDFKQGLGFLANGKSKEHAVQG